ncbi:Palmitoyltransferase [Orbilia oligospora]|uniref:Palmitoyltransferase PFA4 n=1 Tax=Orbilia oligospora TaxID=2813651 RepID=A0A7C8J9P3_ORBOL|nr:Palmitoyltransferase [Orbilia oligospora]
MLNPKYSLIAVGFTVCLITFLAYGSQLFILELSTREFWIFNTLVGGIWVTYFRCIVTDPGGVPNGWQPSWQGIGSFGGGEEEDEGDGEGGSSSDDDDDDDDEDGGGKKGGVREQVKPDRYGRIWGNADCRWCKRCKRWKPARAHHCKTCQTCVLLMDHHCPWTFNCVGYRTWPHFIRFLSFVVAACSYLETFLVSKCLEIWRYRDLPAYLGPSTSNLILLVVLLLASTLTDFAIIVLWIRIIANITEGYTTIEWWEQERHNALVRRKVVRRQLYPFDIGIYSNICLFMNGGVFTWWFPFLPNRAIGEGGTGGNGGGLRYEVNGFEKTWLSWPPPDPEKFGINERRHMQKEMEGGPWTTGEYDVSDVSAFRRRQREDMKRRGYQKGDDDKDDYASEGEEGGRDMNNYKRDEDLLDSYLDSTAGGYEGRGIEGTYYDEKKRQEEIKKKWRNEEGERLADYGVDEDADVLDDEDSVPLAELLRRRREKEVLMGGKYR